MAATFGLFDRLSTQAIWFFSGGLLMVLGAAVNLLNRSYGHVAPGLVLVCGGANVVITAVAVVSGIVGRASWPQWLVVLAILLPLTVLSLSRRVLPPSKHGTAIR